MTHKPSIFARNQQYDPNYKGPNPQAWVAGYQRPIVSSSVGFRQAKKLDEHLYDKELADLSRIPHTE
jgi:hypothetical protein